jgi:hypothetical protein
MISTREVELSPISKALSAGFVSVAEHGRGGGAGLCKVWKWLTRHSRGVMTRGMARRLKVAETVSLGEKRFVTILQVDGEQFLVGGSPSNIVLLAKLEGRPDTFGAGSFESTFSRAESGAGESETRSNGAAGGTR